MLVVYTLQFFSIERIKSKKGPFNLGSWVNPPPVFCQQSKYLITKDPLTLSKGQTFYGSSIKTDPQGDRFMMVGRLPWLGHASSQERSKGTWQWQ